jgi:hypothetical protein
MKDNTKVIEIYKGVDIYKYISGPHKNGLVFVFKGRAYQRKGEGDLIKMARLTINKLHKDGTRDFVG